MTDQDPWRGIHPHRFAMGYIVVEVYGFGLLTGHHAFTRWGAERKRRRMRRRRDRIEQQQRESGLAPGTVSIYTLRMKDHPGRRAA